MTGIVGIGELFTNEAAQAARTYVQRVDASFCVSHYSVSDVCVYHGARKRFSKRAHAAGGAHLSDHRTVYAIFRVYPLGFRGVTSLLQIFCWQRSYFARKVTVVPNATGLSVSSRLRDVTFKIERPIGRARGTVHPQSGHRLPAWTPIGLII